MTDPASIPAPIPAPAEPAEATAATEGRGSSDAPVRRLTVLYDQECPLCRHVRGWLERQRQLVPLEFVPAGSPQAQQRFAALDHARTLREITVIGDSGQVYEATAAWVVCLWALSDYRAMSHRFSTPSGARLARGMVLTAARWRAAAKASGRPTAQGTAGRPGPPSCDDDHCVPRSG
jgi:predicted DCC family thiol-disulfide oxidoreductase YuxK